MIQVGLLTIEQKQEITGQEFVKDGHFHPIQDMDENWVISLKEIEQCVNDNFIWVKNLPLIEYKPMQNLDIF
jgi:hypothetical protein